MCLPIFMVCIQNTVFICLYYFNVDVDVNSYLFHEYADVIKSFTTSKKWVYTHTE
jgi:hypothetical protein